MENILGSFSHNRSRSVRCVVTLVATLAIATQTLHSTDAIFTKLNQAYAQTVEILDGTAANTRTHTIQVSPAFQELVVLENQSTVQGEISLKNDTSTLQTFSVYAVDIKQFDSDGRVILADRPMSGANYSLADFIDISAAEVALSPGESRSLPFQITNSTSLSPGGHYAALVSRATATSSASVQQVLPALSSFVLVRKIGGEQYHLSLTKTDFSHKLFQWKLPETATLTFSNQGNVHVIPRGTVEIHDIFGRLTHKGTINLSSLYLFPGTQRQISVELPQVSNNWPIMLNTVQVSGRSDPGDIVFDQTHSFVFVDFNALVALLLLVTLVPVLLILRRRRA